MSDSIGLTVDCDGKPIAWGTYTPCTQCGGQCIKNDCFGGSCSYDERVSHNRFDGPNPVTRGEQCIPMYSRCRGMEPQKCYKVAPNIYNFGDSNYMKESAKFFSYNNGFDIEQPGYVGNGITCGTFPVTNNSAFKPLTHFSAL